MRIVFKLFTASVVVVAMLNLVSFNCNGLKDINKLTNIFVSFQEKHANIVLLQEPFWDDNFVNSIQDKWNGKIIACKGQNGQQGVAILIKK